jgi:hypothetical protein
MEGLKIDTESSYLGCVVGVIATAFFLGKFAKHSWRIDHSIPYFLFIFMFAMGSYNHFYMRIFFTYIPYFYIVVFLLSCGNDVIQQNIINIDNRNYHAEIIFNYELDTFLRKNNYYNSFGANYLDAGPLMGIIKHNLASKEYLHKWFNGNNHKEYTLLVIKDTTKNAMDDENYKYVNPSSLYYHATDELNIIGSSAKLT